MLVTRLDECPEFLAGDHTHLRELLHPGRAPVRIRYSVAYGWIECGQRSKRHRLTTAEVYYFLAGRGRVTVGEETAVVESGSVVYVPQGATQWVENVGPDRLQFLCLVDPAWRAEDEEVLE